MQQSNDTPAGHGDEAAAPVVVSVLINGTACTTCIGKDPEVAEIPWAENMAGASTSVLIIVGAASNSGSADGHVDVGVDDTGHGHGVVGADTDSGAGAGSNDGVRASTDNHAAVDGEYAKRAWTAATTEKQVFTADSVPSACAINSTSVAGWVAHAKAFDSAMVAAGLSDRFEVSMRLICPTRTKIQLANQWLAFTANQ